MAKMKLNLSDYDGGDFSPIPEDNYEAYVYEIKPKTFSTGSKGFSIRYKIANGEYKGRYIFDNIVESVKFKVAQFYKAVTGEKSGNVEIDTDTFPSYKGRKVEIKVAIEPDFNDDTKKRNVVKGVSYVEGGSESGGSPADLNAMLGEREGIEVNDEALPF